MATGRKTSLWQTRSQQVCFRLSCIGHGFFSMLQCTRLLLTAMDMFASQSMDLLSSLMLYPEFQCNGSAFLSHTLHLFCCPPSRARENFKSRGRLKIKHTTGGWETTNEPGDKIGPTPQGGVKSNPMFYHMGGEASLESDGRRRPTSAAP